MTIFHKRKCSTPELTLQPIPKQDLPTGIPNLGNTCYMAGLIQILKHSAEFRERMLKNSFPEATAGEYLKILMK